jgi:hypothetical protein
MPSHNAVSEETILEAIREMADDGPPKLAEFDENGPCSSATIYNKFGSWAEALREAGFIPNVGHGVTRQDIIEDIQRLAKEKGRPPDSTEFNEEGIVAYSTTLKHFDSWQSVVEAAGFEYNKYRISEDDLLEEIHRLKNEHGRVPTQQHVINGKYSVTPFRKRWGTWNAALREAGYKPRKFRISKEECLSKLQDLADELGRTPRVEEVNDADRISERPYQDKFYSWWAALVRAGLKPQKPRPLSPEAFSRLHSAAVSKKDTKTTDALCTLLLQFTGLTRDMLSSMDEDWVRELGDEVIISVPRDFIRTDERWEFRVPETWHEPVSGDEKQTQLPSLLLWYFELNDGLFGGSGGVHQGLYRIASTADLGEFREVYDERRGVEDTLRIKPADLRVTHGIYLARNGAPSELIQRRLGLDAVGSHIDVQELFIWLDEREDYQHPEYTVE